MRTIAVLLNAFGAGLLVFQASEQVAMAPGLLGALLGLAAIWLVSGRVRVVLAALSALSWLAALVLAVGTSPVAALATAAGLIGTALTVARGAVWPGWSSRYSRAVTPSEETAISPREMWENLDRGLDPTRRADASPDD